MRSFGGDLQFETIFSCRWGILAFQKVGPSLPTAPTDVPTTSSEPERKSQQVQMGVRKQRAHRTTQGSLSGDG